MSGWRDEVENCECCGISAEDMAIDDGSGLCLYCQPCGWCGRMGVGCNSQYRDAGCDPVDYPDRPRRDVNEVMAELSRDRRDRQDRERAATITNDSPPHTTRP